MDLNKVHVISDNSDIDITLHCQVYDDYNSAMDLTLHCLVFDEYNTVQYDFQ